MGIVAVMVAAGRGITPSDDQQSPAEGTQPYRVSSQRPLMRPRSRLNLADLLNGDRSASHLLLESPTDNDETVIDACCFQGI